MHIYRHRGEGRRFSKAILNFVCEPGSNLFNFWCISFIAWEIFVVSILISNCIVFREAPSFCICCSITLSLFSTISTFSRICLAILVCSFSFSSSWTVLLDFFWDFPEFEDLGGLGWGGDCGVSFCVSSQKEHLPSRMSVVLSRRKTKFIFFRHWLLLQL